MRLGRHLALDGRSLDYAIENDTVQMGRPIQPVAWPAPIPILNQGNLGSCTGNAGTRMVAFLHKDDLASVKLNGFGLSDDASLDEQFAVELYHEASEDDEVDGEYPPDDTGSTGLGIMRALKAAGLIRRYEWATTLRGVAVLMQRGPICIGTPWFQGWFEPDGQGFIDSGEWGDVAGGHEIYGARLLSWDDGDPSQSVIEFENSWDTSWGVNGCGRMRLSTYEQLKDQMDIKQGILVPAGDDEEQQGYVLRGA